jgi:hypothetical protein
MMTRHRRGHWRLSGIGADCAATDWREDDVRRVGWCRRSGLKEGWGRGRCRCRLCDGRIAGRYGFRLLSLQMREVLMEDCLGRRPVAFSSAQLAQLLGFVHRDAG